MLFAAKSWRTKHFSTLPTYIRYRETVVEASLLVKGCVGDELYSREDDGRTPSKGRMPRSFSVFMDEFISDSD